MGRVTVTVAVASVGSCRQVLSMLGGVLVPVAVAVAMVVREQWSFRHRLRLSMYWSNQGHGVTQLPLVFWLLLNNVIQALLHLLGNSLDQLGRGFVL
jgi:hypothetical protein